MENLPLITNEIFGQSKAIHPPVDYNIKRSLNKQLGHYVESTNENKGTPSEKLVRNLDLLGAIPVEAGETVE